MRSRPPSTSRTDAPAERGVAERRVGGGGRIPREGSVRQRDPAAAPRIQETHLLADAVCLLGTAARLPASWSLQLVPGDETRSLVVSQPSERRFLAPLPPRSEAAGSPDDFCYPSDGRVRVPWWARGHRRVWCASVPATLPAPPTARCLGRGGTAEVCKEMDDRCLRGLGSLREHKPAPVFARGEDGEKRDVEAPVFARGEDGEKRLGRRLALQRRTNAARLSPRASTNLEPSSPRHGGGVICRIVRGPLRLCRGGREPREGAQYNHLEDHRAGDPQNRPGRVAGRPCPAEWSCARRESCRRGQGRGQGRPSSPGSLQGSCNHSAEM